MTKEDKDQLKDIVNRLDILLESDEIEKETWHKLNNIYHELEVILEEG